MNTDNVAKLLELVKEKQRETLQESVEKIPVKSGFEFPPTKITIHRNLNKKPNGKHFIKKEGWETVEVPGVREFIYYVTNYCWCPGIYKRDLRRQEEFISAEMAVLDCDGTLTLGAAMDWANERGLFYILAPTLNHQKVTEEKDAADRFRFIMRFWHPISDIREYRYNVNVLIRTLGSDEVCKDAARYYEPSTSIHTMYDGAYLAIEPKKISLAEEIKNQMINEKLELLGTPRDYILRWIVGEGIAPGNRHIRCFAIACELYRCGYTKDQIRRVINSIQFNRGAEAGFKTFEETDLELILKNSYENTQREKTNGSKSF